MGNRNERLQGKILEVREPDAKAPLIVAYAGQSYRRLSFLQHAFPDTPVHSVDGGDEPDIPHVVDIMRGKIDHGSTLIFHRLMPQAHRFGIVAADIRTSTLTPPDEKDGNTFLTSRGKPPHEGTRQSVQHIFEQMSTAAEVGEEVPYYIVIAGSGAKIREGNTQSVHIGQQACTVELDEEYLSYLATDKGITDYQTTFQHFYSSPPYSNNGSHPAVDLTDLSGGISLPVLTRMGAVNAVNGVNAKDPAFPETLREGIFTVAVGFSPDVLKPLQSTINQAIQEWPWLTRVVEHTLTK